jgi:2,3-bisphosphoglycerate-dependent phosphoglycerate mutase
MATLVLVRHGLSEYNEKGLWTGWTDVELHPEGIKDAHNMAALIKDIKFDKAYVSTLKRALKTAHIILEDLNQEDIPFIENKDLNERDYGVYTGKNKWQVKEEVGEEEFQKIRRGWDHPIPEGESMKQVYERIVPYFTQTILPELKVGKNILIAASGNSLRALTKYLCNLSVEDVCNLEIGIGEVHVYQIDEEGTVTATEIRGENPNKGLV